MATHARPLVLRLLGDMTLECNGVSRALPKSRKTRALLAYLAIQAGAIRRETLCELFWESADDPRAALRWSLSKLRPLLNTPCGQALHADAHAVALNPALVAVDALEAKALLDQPFIEDTHTQLDLMEQVLASGYPRDLDIPASYRYQLWIGGEREVMRRVHRRVLDEQSARASSADAALATARKRAALDPLDNESNARLLVQSVEVDGHARARAALEGMRARYRAEGISDHALVASWRGLDPAAMIELPDKPSVAVLGFTDLGGHEDGLVLAEGLAADLTLALGHMRSLFVIARASSARFSARSADQLPLAGRMLGVRYLVHGTTQRLDRRVRVNVTLADAQKNDVLWCEHFDRSIGDLFSIQDDVSAAIASAIEPEISRAEGERARLKSSEDLSAWECYHRAMWHCFRFTAPHTEQAHAYFLRALVLDRGFARAHAGLSFTHFSRAFLDSVPAPDTEVEKALRCAQQSIELDPRDAMGHWTLGRARFLAREHDQAIQSVSRSLEVNPNFAQGHYALGFIRVHAGLVRQALPALATAERLSPYDPLLFAIEASRALSLAIEGRCAEAAVWGVRATSEPNAHFHIQAVAAACLALASRDEEARGYAKRACSAHPGYSIRAFERSFPQKFAKHQELLAQALRSAGVPNGEP
jgi:TolB-like protein/regulator of sirC expression with transglutaminase-like and TPR domain